MVEFDASLVSRLRDAAEHGDQRGLGVLLTEAADEVERLSAVVAEYAENIRALDNRVAEMRAQEMVLELDDDG